MFTYSKKTRKPGSSVITIDVDCNGKPYGQLWTFAKKKGYYHPWHSKPLNGEHKAFYPADGGLKSAIKHMEA